MTQDVAAIMASTTYRDAVAVLDRDHDRIVDDIIRLTEIPSPPFGVAGTATGLSDW
jgi:tripeptide aminopeptidase